MNTYRPCPICKDNNFKEYFKFTNEILKNKYSFTSKQIKYLSTTEDGTIDIVICNSCGMVFVKNNYRFSEMRKFLKIPSDKPLKMPELKTEHNNIAPEQFLSKYHIAQQLLRLLVNSKKDISILDFGGGYTGFYARLANIYGRAKCVVYDPIVEKAEVDGINFANNISELKIHGPFDGIFCNQVLEHCLDPKKELENIYQLLGKDGIAYLGVPLINYKKLSMYIKDINENRGKASKIFNPDHVNYFSLSNFTKLIKDVGLQILPYQLELFLTRPYSFYNPLENIMLRVAGILRYTGFRFTLLFNIHNDFTRIFASGFFVRKI